MRSRHCLTICATGVWSRKCRWSSGENSARTAVISKIVGRDQRPRVNSAPLAGVGMRTGQTIGATDRSGGEPVERPVTFGEIFSMLYRKLGIDTDAVTLTDLNGRPQYLVEGQACPLPELV